MAENKLLFTLDLVKEKLAEAYTERDESCMAKKINDIIDLCKTADCKHLHWFEKLLINHFKGIIVMPPIRFPATRWRARSNASRLYADRATGIRTMSIPLLEIFNMS